MRDFMLRWICRRGFVVSGVLSVFILTALLMPLPDRAHVGGSFDKVVHFVLFFVLVLPALSVRPRIWVWLVPLATLFGVAIEFVQPVFGRGKEYADMLANGMGALAAVPVGYLIHRIWADSRRRRESKARQLREREGAQQQN